MVGKKIKKKVQKRGQLPFAICIVACAPVRKRPSDREEMVTQLLFGECVEVVVKKHNSWMEIKCVSDGYEGWIDPKQVIRVSEEEVIEYQESPSYCMDIIHSISNGDQAFPILMGSTLPKFDGLHCYLHDDKFVYNGMVTCPTKMEKITPEFVERIAKKFIHAPYLWGGRSIFGIDCSGFTQIVYKLLGIKLPRDADQQVKEGEIIDFLNQAKVGDLAFFENEENKIIHVGIILGDSKIIHASGQVRIDKLDHEGIYNADLQKYTHKLRVAKRIITDF